jgi:5'-3' exonuclease, C-terminal SAM fold
MIPDFVGLKGDTSDNIPGVPGIGDKTASQLLQEYGDLEGVLSNIDSISGAKRKQNLTEHAEAARISKRLATANREIEVAVDLDGIAAREPDRSALRTTFREFELRAPLERLEEALGEDDAAPAERVAELIEAEAREVPLAELAALDSELVAIAALRPGESPDEAAAAAATAEEDPDEAPGVEADDAVEIAEAPPAAAAGSAASRWPRASARVPSTSRGPYRGAPSPSPPGPATRRCSSPRPRRSPPSSWPAATGRWSPTTGRPSPWRTTPAQRRRWTTTRWSPPT